MRSILRPCIPFAVGLALAACHAPKADPTPRHVAWPKYAEPAKSPTRALVQQPARLEAPVARAERRAPSLRQRLRTAKLQGIRFTTENGDYPTVIRRIRTVTDVPIVTTPDARGVFESEGLALAVDLRSPVSVHDLLDLMVGQSEQLRWNVEHDVVFIDARGAGPDRSLALEYYDVRQLVVARTQFIAPRIGGIPTGDDERPRTGAEAEERVQTFDADTLVDTLKLATDPKFWENEPGASIELAESGTLIVRATPAIHRRIRKLIGG